MHTEEKKLNLLQLEISGHPMFEDNTIFSLVNEDRVLDDDKDRLHHLFNNVWTNQLITLIGKNATGKTTILKTIIGVLTLLLHHKSIDQTPLTDVLIGKQPITFTIYLYGSDGIIYKDVITFERSAMNQWLITSEKIYQKKAKKTMPKKQLFDFSEVKKPQIDRNKLDDVAASMLANDDSIFRTIVNQNEYQIPFIIDTLAFTNVNALFYPSDVPGEILQFLDPTIEYLKIEKLKNDDGERTLFYRLKFKNHPEEYTETNFATIEHYLSSGTAKGVTLYGNVLFTLQTGGILFVDELENHFNHAIVQSFIEYFVDPTINKHHATLIFSTHYSELLSSIELNDEIYFTKRDRHFALQRYSRADVRKDLNRTDVFDSNYLGGTAPNYDAYMALKKATRQAVNGE